MITSPSCMVGCFVPNSSIISVVKTSKIPEISTFLIIGPPVSSYLLSNAVCNPSVFAMVKSPSCIVSCFPCNVSSTSPISGNVLFVLHLMNH